MRLAATIIFFAMTLTYPALAANQVVCQEFGTPQSYRLDFAWPKGKVDISTRQGNGTWQTIHRSATAVRNNASDPAFLAEGTGATWAGGFGNKCGRFIQKLYFDVARQGGKMVGTLEKTPEWLRLNPKKACSAGVPAPELATTSVRVTCQ